MDHDALINEPGKVVLSSEAPYGRAIRALNLAFPNLFGIAAAYGARYDPRPFEEWRRAAVGVAASATCLLLGLAFSQLPARGQWVLDRSGVAYTPLRGRPRRIAWGEVRSFYQDRARTRLSSGRETICIPWFSFPREVGDRARGFLDGIRFDRLRSS